MSFVDSTQTPRLEVTCAESTSISNLQVEEFDQNGYVILRAVFNDTEVAAMRKAIEDQALEAKSRGLVFRPSINESVPVGDLVGFKGLGQVLCDQRILSIARGLIKASPIVYFGDSSIYMGAGGARGFHKDNTNRVDPTHTDWRSRYTLVRFGIYLQDHVNHSGGLKLRVGSHRFVDVRSGKMLDVPTTSGDIVVWSLRTSHSGNAVKLRGFSRRAIPPRFEHRVPRFLRVPEADTRMAIFITYGTRDEHLANYLAKHTDLKKYADNYLYKSWIYSARSPELEKVAESRGCVFIYPVEDYGSLYGTAPGRAPFLTTGPGRPDVYLPGSQPSPW